MRRHTVDLREPYSLKPHLPCLCTRASTCEWTWVQACAEEMCAAVYNRRGRDRRCGLGMSGRRGRIDASPPVQTRPPTPPHTPGPTLSACRAHMSEPHASGPRSSRSLIGTVGRWIRSALGSSRPRRYRPYRTPVTPHRCCVGLGSALKRSRNNLSPAVATRIARQSLETVIAITNMR